MRNHWATHVRRLLHAFAEAGSQPLRKIFNYSLRWRYRSSSAPR
jgi:hypothetical protein